MVAFSLLKGKVKKALNYVTDFENAVAAEARRRGHQGVVCGHIHRAEMREIDGILYCNDGDWVESCTALVEHRDGRFGTRALAWKCIAPRVGARGTAGGRMKIALVTDAWQPQVNGVVTTLVELVQQLESRGHQVMVIHPGLFRTRPCPGYAGIDLAVRPFKVLTGLLNDYQPDAIHLATEGPLGWAARKYCLRTAWRSPPPFTRVFQRFCKRRWVFHWLGGMPFFAIFTDPLQGDGADAGRDEYVGPTWLSQLASVDSWGRHSGISI